MSESPPLMCVKYPLVSLRKTSRLKETVNGLPFDNLIDPPVCTKTLSLYIPKTPAAPHPQLPPIPAPTEPIYLRYCGLQDFNSNSFDHFIPETMVRLNHSASLGCIGIRLKSWNHVLRNKFLLLMGIVEQNLVQLLNNLRKYWCPSNDSFFTLATEQYLKNLKYSIAIPSHYLSQWNKIIDEIHYCSRLRFLTYFPLRVTPDEFETEKEFISKITSYTSNTRLLTERRLEASFRKKRTLSRVSLSCLSLSFSLCLFLKLPALEFVMICQSILSLMFALFVNSFQVHQGTIFGTSMFVFNMSLFFSSFHFFSFFFIFFFHFFFFTDPHFSAICDLRCHIPDIKMGSLGFMSSRSQLNLHPYMPENLDVDHKPGSYDFIPQFSFSSLSTNSLNDFRLEASLWGKHHLLRDSLQFFFPIGVHRLVRLNKKLKSDLRTGIIWIFLLLPGMVVMRLSDPVENVSWDHLIKAEITLCYLVQFYTSQTLVPLWPQFQKAQGRIKIP
ncbi:hypothetical protein VP01_3718g1 [Puccinia sorghi]|uniref:Uncharacterized protein n=1 Tax=Puccinia sorghi TaxID=27349 RepID=A0A0L6UU68_9BASI|nr:hypothetical protein VP01_3718g1 [Puccinia sorghi]